MIGEHKPDVVTLDLQMPKMDGLTALKHILIRYPRPVVVLSAFAKETSRPTYESFKYGAVDVLSKPANGSGFSGMQDRELCDRVLQASRVQLNAVRYVRCKKKNSRGALPLPKGQAVSSSSAAKVDPQAEKAMSAGPEINSGPDKMLIILSGAGGFPSLLRLIFSIPDPERMPATLLAVDMSRHVVESLVFNLKEDTSVNVELISASGQLKPGTCYFVSNENRCRIIEDQNQIRVEIVEDANRTDVENTSAEADSHFFDNLLTHAAGFLNTRLAAVLVSGTGEDGIEGMRQVKESGGAGFALSPNACLRPDLPRKIIDLGYAREIKKMDDIAGLLDVGLFTADREFARSPGEDKPALDSI
jgi:two-component system chemotaxis response regulator CheB